MISLKTKLSHDLIGNLEEMERKHKEYDQNEMGKPDIKLILIGDTACGKSK